MTSKARSFLGGQGIWSMVRSDQDPCKRPNLKLKGLHMAQTEEHREVYSGESCKKCDEPGKNGNGRVPGQGFLKQQGLGGPALNAAAHS